MNREVDNMEINMEEFVQQLYRERVRFLISGLVSIEEQLEKLKLEKFSYPLRAIVIALSIEELDISKLIMKPLDKKTKTIVKDMIKNDKTKKKSK